MKLLSSLRTEAVQRELLDQHKQMDLALVYSLVRDMTYQRASDRKPETLIREWRGTCSGKHYLLQALFNELGYNSDVVACTSVEDISQEIVPQELQIQWQNAGGRFVDVHNYLILKLPEGNMIVDATWPIGSEKYGLRVNKNFIIGEDQQIACDPIRNWVIPKDTDPQAFKDRLLEEYFTPQELVFREAFILQLGKWFSKGVDPRTDA